MRQLLKTRAVDDSWKSIQGTKLSRDGVWLAYALTPQHGDRPARRQDLKTSVEHRAPRGRDATITSDGKFVVFSIAPLKADVDKARKAKKKPEDMPKPGVGIMDLATGTVTTAAERVKSFRVPEDSPRFVAILTAAPERAAGERSSAGSGFFALSMPVDDCASRIARTRAERPIRAVFIEVHEAVATLPGKHPPLLVCRHGATQPRVSLGGRDRPQL